MNINVDKISNLYGWCISKRNGYKLPVTTNRKTKQRNEKSVICKYGKNCTIIEILGIFHTSRDIVSHSGYRVEICHVWVAVDHWKTEKCHFLAPMVAHWQCDDVHDEMNCVGGLEEGMLMF